MTPKDKPAASIVRYASLEELPPAPPLRRLPSERLTLGLPAFDKISAIEGVALPPASREMFAAFEQQGLTAAERRAAIRTKHTKPKR